MPNFADRNSKAAITLMFTSLTDFSWEHFIEHCFIRHLLDYYYLWFSVTNWTRGNKTETCSWPVFSFENCCILTLIEEPIYLRLKEPECEKFSFLSDKFTTTSVLYKEFSPVWTIGSHQVKPCFLRGKVTSALRRRNMTSRIIQCTL